MSDWLISARLLFRVLILTPAYPRFGTYSVDLAIKAGLDLEMPGPPRWRTPILMNHCLSAQKVHVKDIDSRATALLSFVQKLARKNTDIVYGDGEERSRDSPESRLFCRKLATETMVLLKNRSNLLPFRSDKFKTIAVIGPHVKASVVSGGGSAALRPTYVITPWEGILKNAPKGVELKYAVGCYGKCFLYVTNGLLTFLSSRSIPPNS